MLHWLLSGFTAAPLNFPFLEQMITWHRVTDRPATQPWYVVTDIVFIPLLFYLDTLIVLCLDCVDYCHDCFGCQHTLKPQLLSLLYGPVTVLNYIKDAKCENHLANITSTQILHQRRKVWNHLVNITSTQILHHRRKLSVKITIDNGLEEVSPQLRRLCGQYGCVYNLNNKM